MWVSEAGAHRLERTKCRHSGCSAQPNCCCRSSNVCTGTVLFDLPKTWTATTRHKEAEGSAYYRHYYMGLIREDGTPKPVADEFPEGLGICQWFHFEDHRLDSGVEWLRKLGVKYLRTGMSWADWFRPNCGDVVRSPDVGARRVRYDDDALFYA